MSHWDEVFQLAYQSFEVLRVSYSLLSSLATSACCPPTLPGVMVSGGGTSLPGRIRAVAGRKHLGSSLEVTQSGIFRKSTQLPIQGLREVKGRMVDEC